MTKLSQPSGLDQSPPQLFDRLHDYLKPFIILGLGGYYFILTCFTSPLLLISDLQTFRHKAFARFWSAYGAFLSAEMPIGTAELLSSCSGVILDVGPGSGTQVHFFDPRKVKMIYAVEPAVDLHPQLCEAAEKAGLGGKYDILAAGAQPGSLVPELAKRGLMGSGGEAIFDTVVCIRVLCGVPNPLSTIDGLYRLLKPGGRFIVCEHVKQTYPNRGDVISNLVQRFCTLIGWSFWLGGCCLDRDTDAVLRRVAGDDGWERFNARYLDTYSPVPYLVGEYVKAK